MSSVTIDGVAYSLPLDEYQAQKIAAYNGVLAPLNTAWASWTPTWTSLTIGNATVVAKYRQIGKLVFSRLSIVFGSTTSVSGDIQFSLPVTALSYGSMVLAAPLGFARLWDSSASLVLHGLMTFQSTTLGHVRVSQASGTNLTDVFISSTVPFTWATSDEIHTQFFYEAA